MNAYPTEKIRNIVLLGHQGTGKTTLVEAMLYTSKAVDRLGRVDDGNSTTDFDQDEIKRKTSISLAIAPCPWKDYKINCLDAPGFLDFVSEVKSGLRVAEGAVLLASANSQIEVGFEINWKYLSKTKMPKMIFINKMDKENANFYQLYEEMKSRFSTHIAPVQLPVGAAENFKGVIDLIEGAAYEFDGKQSKKIDIPSDMEADYNKYREQLMESAAETDDALITKYLDGTPLTTEEIKTAIKKGTKEGKIIPVLCGSAYGNMGADLVMDFVADCIPAPNEVGNVKGINPKSGQEEEREISSSAPFSAFVFRTAADPFVGKLNMIKIYSGTLKEDMVVYNATKERDEKLSNIFVSKGKHQQEIKELFAGDIFVASKLQETTTQDTLCAKDKPIIYPKIEFPEPVLHMAVFPKSRADEDKLGSALSKLSEEDPTFICVRNIETKENIIKGMGDLHIDINMDKLKRKFGVEVELATPKVAYKETIKGKAKAEGKYKKQSGGRGQYGHVWLEIEPLSREKEFEFVDKIVGGVVPKNYIPSVEKGVKEAMSDGILSIYPMVGVKVTLYDGSYHTVDSSDMAFKIAAAMGLRKAVDSASPVLLEPIYNLELLVPDSYMGDCIGDLNSKRGRIMGMDPQGNGDQLIKAQVPLAEMQKYVIDLKSITQGRGMFKMIFSHYEELAPNLAESVLAASKKKGDEEE
ncbi:MAG: elongation factor G [Armatimonadota bacterium]